MGKSNPHFCRLHRDFLATYGRALLFSALVLCGCDRHPAEHAQSIQFTRVPQAVPGGSDDNDIIEGRTVGALPGQQLVLYAKSGNWWIQPLANRRLTRIQGNSWISPTHLGAEYAALLIQPDYHPPAMLVALPPRGGPVLAVASVPGASSPPSPAIEFGGYPWRVRNAPSSRGGKSSPYEPRNVSVDAQGALHLRISRAGKDWSCSEISLQRNLGYGTYSFVVRDVSGLEPAALFTILTYDYTRAEENYGEVDIEIGRWGDPATRNAKYTIQPHYVTGNVSTFEAPAGTLTYTLEWKPGHMLFRTRRLLAGGVAGPVVAEHLFTSGVPAPSLESVRMNLYVYGFPRVPLKREAEVVVEKFEFLP